MDSAFSLSNITQNNTNVNELQNSPVTSDYRFTNRSARDARLLKGETMGGLTGCDSFEVGDAAKQEFYSPNYPEEYPSNAMCTKRIVGK